MQETLGIGSGALSTILHDYIGVSKRCTRWVPHNLSEEQKAARVQWCQFMLEKFEDGHPRQVWDIITGDDT